MFTQKIHLISSDTSSDLQEKFESLFPTWPVVVATIMTVLVGLMVLTKFAYKPIKKMHDERKEYIQSNIDSAEKQNDDAMKDRDKANEELINARLEAAEIVSQAKVEAEKVRIEKIQKAENDAKKVVDNAKVSIALQQAKFDEESKAAIVDVALEAASKIIEKNVDNKTNRKIVSDYIKVQK